MASQELTGFVGNAHNLAVVMKLSADKATTYVEELLSDTRKVSSMLEYIRTRIIAGRETPSPRDVEALALTSQCEGIVKDIDTYIALAVDAQAAGETVDDSLNDAVAILWDTLKGKLAYLGAKMPATVYTESGKREKNETHSLAMRGLRTIVGRATRTKVSYVPSDMRGMMDKAEAAEAARIAKRDARLVAEAEKAKQAALTAPVAPETPETPEATI